ncbi:MAG: methionine adenosyltransferase [Candidatus Tectomicrobia bacterium]|uniref:S-adenosylmethionine synthase n=1 Tax=Tectimicrobiota bacterium TaxID=2528274 RepID=A0A938B4T5_UNCTE|nr:methionine adenosyltransferase [Candidatus Tectomicrobia bacterium]
MRVTFASESVTEGHPDKVCDKISDSVLDAALALDPRARVACETMVSENLTVITGEVSDVVLEKLDIAAIARQAIRDIGYTTDSIGFAADTCNVQVYLKPQSPDISQGVSAGQGLFKEQGAGDQGMMFGYATKEAQLNDVATELMPTPIYFAHRLTRRLAEVRKQGIIQGLYPDGKAQVAIEYENNRPVAIANLVISTHHASSLSLRDLRHQLIEHVMKPVIPDRLLAHHVMDQERDRLDSTIIFVNPTGAFLVGGPKADAGLTGRKIIVDTYGGMGRHGGGAFSGKDPSKVDRSAAYMARYIAKNVVAAELADVCEVQIAYVIGHANPVSVHVQTTNPTVSDDKISQAILAVFDMRPAAIIERLSMLRPIYRDTAAYGHFGRPEFPWEAADRVAELQRAVA